MWGPRMHAGRLKRLRLNAGTTYVLSLDGGVQPWALSRRVQGGVKNSPWGGGLEMLYSRVLRSIAGESMGH